MSPTIKTQDEGESSPTAPIRARVADSLSLSSPFRQIKNLSSPSPTESLTEEYSSSSSDDDEEIDSSSDDDVKIELTKPTVIFPSSAPKNEPTGVGAGLNNSGNTCFIASVLQCLTHTVPLLDSLRAYQYQFPCNCGNENFCVLHTLQNHIEHALRSSGYDIKIDQFRDNLNYFSSDFLINRQEDAHEFLQSVFEKLEKCCLDRSGRNNPASVSSQDVNMVHNVFGGRLVSKLRCCNCNSFSETFETSPGWSLEIEDVEDLSSALESFTCVEKLEDQLTCDDCKERVSKEKQLKFDKLPLVATFHLKRFKNNGFYMEKISKDVKFPLELDFLPYMSSNESPEVNTKYHLYAMVEHLGNGTHFGHYTAYVRSAPETWHHFDDAKVGRLREECVLPKSAYMLFYAREGIPCFASAFEELKTLFEATRMNFSPTPVLETDHSYQNVSDSINACYGSVGSDYHCDEPQDEVFHSAESNTDDELLPFESLKVDDSEKPFAERPLYPAGNIITIDELYVHVLKIQAAERAIIGEDAYLPNPKIPKPNLFPKGTVQIQRAHLQNKKKIAETRGAKPSRIFVGADPKEKRHAVSSRFQLLTAALGVNVKRKKASNIRRNLSQWQSDESL